MSLVVAAALVDDLTDPTVVLATRRSYPSALAGRWEFPGGKVHDGEAPVDALHRELAEELEITAVVDAEIVGPCAGAWPLVPPHRMRLWLAAVASGSPRACGAHNELRWLPVRDLHHLPWLDPDRPIVAELQRRLAPGL
ncbi:MAG: (deoxy)nucleoside triphosphate pyrophosphohydrolase [Actinomycetes bacterium]